LLNTGANVAQSKNRLLTTIAFRKGERMAYAIEGSIFIAGAVVQWLRDGLHIIKSVEEADTVAAQAKDMAGLYFVPAFTGLGAPYWDADARGAIVGLTRDAGAAEIARAALDAVCYQTRDLLVAMAADLEDIGLAMPRIMRVDGGMVTSDGFCQRLADLTGVTVERPQITETTALGAALLAGLGAGVFGDDDIAGLWRLDRRFEPAMPAEKRDSFYDGWCQAVARTRTRSSLT
jgi:glycerol kinase